MLYQPPYSMLYRARSPNTNAKLMTELFQHRSQTRSSMSIRTALSRIFFVHQLGHKAHVVVLGHVSVFLEVGALVLGHRLDKVFDQLVRNERVP